MKNLTLISILILLFTWLIYPEITNAQRLTYTTKGYYEWFQYLGKYFTMSIGNRMPFTDVTIIGPDNNPVTARFLLDLGTDTTVIDLYGFPGRVINRPANQIYSLTIGTPGFHVDTVFTQYCNNQSLGGYLANGITESGIIGTDILSKMMVTFDYKYSRVYMIADPKSFCTAETMVRNGFIPVSTKGFYQKHPSNVPNHNNNPMIPIAVSSGKNSVMALAFVDSGFDDLIQFPGDFDNYFTHNISINQFFLDTLNIKGIKVGIDKNHYCLLTNIKGNPDTLFKCNFADKVTFNIVGFHGEKILPYTSDQFNFFLKVNGNGGKGAGGITTSNFAAAQFGGSILMDCDQITYDPISSLVWFKQK